MLVHAHIVCSSPDCDVAFDLVGEPEEIETAICEECGAGMAVIGFLEPVEPVRRSHLRLVRRDASDDAPLAA